MLTLSSATSFHVPSPPMARPHRYPHSHISPAPPIHTAATEIPVLSCEGYPSSPIPLPLLFPRGVISPPDSLACLENGKAVLCEKSMAPSASEASRVLDLATSRRLFFLHGVWSRFFPAYAEIRRLIESGAIGQVCSVHASFCQRDGAGACSAMAETGVYCAQFLLWVYGGVAPRVVGVSYTLDEDTGLDTHVSAALEWPCGGKGTFECSLRHPSPRGATICGTKGVIEVPFPFWCPTSITVQTMTGRGSQTFGEKTVLSFPLPKVNDADQLNFVNSQGLFYEAAAATQCMLDGAIETTQFSSSECLLVMQLVSDIRAHWMT